jgi:hypothetical protein
LQPLWGIDKIKTQHLEKRKWLGNIKNTMLKVSHIIIYKKREKMIHQIEFIKESIRSTKFPKIKKHNKIKKRKTHNRPKLVSNHPTDKKKRKIINHEKKQKSST